MKTDMHIFSACTQDVYKCIHASRVTNERLRHVHSPCKCTLRGYKPTVRPVASRNLFFDLQEVTLLLGEYTLFALQISTTPLPGYVHIFQQYLQHTYVSIHIRRDVREALILICCSPKKFAQI